MKKIIIIGGGIGGLTLTLKLLRSGFDPILIEQAHQFGEVGAGVVLKAHATAVLHQLGLADQFAQVGYASEYMTIRRWQDSAVLAKGKMNARPDEISPPGQTPNYALYRPDIISVLSAALPTNAIRLHTKCVGVKTADGQRPVVYFADGSTETADLIVGADGIHSVVRESTVNDAPARFSRTAACRITIPNVDRVDESRIWLGPNLHLLIYPVCEGGRRLNIAATVPQPKETVESWTTSVPAEMLRAEFQDWDPEVKDLLGRIQTPVLKSSIYDRKPLTRWSTESTTLLGDAAHPMVPFLGEGANQSIVDADVLTAELIAHPDDVTSALARYEERRRPATAEIQNTAWDQLAYNNLPDGPDQQQRDTQLGLHGLVEFFKSKAAAGLPPD